MEGDVPVKFETVWVPECNVMVAGVKTEPVGDHEIKTELIMDDILDHKSENEGTYDCLEQRDPEADNAANNMLENCSKVIVGSTATSNQKPSYSKNLTSIDTSSAKVKAQNSVQSLYTCEVCNKYHAHFSTLMVHMRTHTGEKPFKCETCGKCFACRGTLISHIKLHTRGKPFKCEMCNECFSHRRTLATHIRAHTAKTAFKCEMCSKCFSTSSALVRHHRNKSHKD